MLSKMLLASTALAVVACGSKPAADSGSDVLQLTNVDFKCVEYSDAEIEANLTGMPDGFMAVETWRIADLRRAKNALAGIPAGYLKYMYELNDFNGFTISQSSLQPGVGGVTTSIGNTSIKVEIAKFNGAADFATQHEVGHVINFAIEDRAGFAAKQTSTFQAEAANSKLRNYVRKSEYEYFAESFNNYYCSKDAHAFLKATLPTTYDFLRQNLSKPRWDIEEVVLSGDLFLSLGGDAEAPVIGLSSPEALNNVGICLGSKKDCVASKKIDVGFNFAGTPSGRNLFKSGSVLTLSNGQVITVLGFDSAGALKAAKSVRFENR